MNETPIKTNVAAIILNYFGAVKTHACILSLINEPLSIINVVDNSANKNEFNKLQNLMQSLSNELKPKIRVIENEENLGFGRAINRVITEGLQKDQKFTHYLLLNNDTVVDTGMVRGLLDKMKSDPVVGLAAPKLVYPDFEIKELWYYRFLGHVAPNASSKLAMPYLTGCCLLVDSDMISNDKLFDEDFFMYGEDIWLNWYVLEQGRSVVSVPEVSLFHEGTGSSKMGNFFYEYHTARGHVLLARKMSRSNWELPLMYSGRAIYLFARALLRAKRFGSFAPLKAYLLCWKFLRIRP